MMTQSVTADRLSRSRHVRAQRRLREKEARRQSILDAASAVFLEWGISATTMDQIAERAELSKGALYLYFSSKQELYLALLVEASRLLVDALKNARAPEAPPFEELQRLMQAYYGFAVRRPDYFRLLFVVEHHLDRSRVADELRARWTVLGREGLEILADVIERGVKQRLIRPCDPRKTAVSLWAGITGVIVLPAQEIRRDFLGHLDQEELVRSTLQNFWKGIQTPAVQGARAPTTRRRGQRRSAAQRAANRALSQ